MESKKTGSPLYADVEFKSFNLADFEAFSVRVQRKAFKLKRSLEIVDAQLKIQRGSNV